MPSFEYAENLPFSSIFAITLFLKSAWPVLSPKIGKILNLNLDALPPYKFSQTQKKIREKFSVVWLVSIVLSVFTCHKNYHNFIYKSGLIHWFSLINTAKYKKATCWGRSWSIYLWSKVDIRDMDIRESWSIQAGFSSMVYILPKIF